MTISRSIRLCLLLTLTPCACGERPEGGGAGGGASGSEFKVELGDKGLRIEHSASALVLEPSVLPGATLGLAFAQRTTESEMSFGYHFFREGSEPWQQGVEIVSTEEPSPGTLRVKLRARDSSATRVGLAWKCGTDRAGAPERYMGLGAQVLFDERGRRVPIWTSEQGIGKAENINHQQFGYVGDVSDAYYPLPVVYSSRGYAIATLGSERVVHDFCRTDAGTHAVEVWDSEVDLVVVVGTPRELVERMTALTGRPPRPPAWAFGPWIDAVGGSAEVRRIARELRTRGVPASALWSEDWAGGGLDATGFRLSYRWTLDRGNYPDAEALASELHQQGFRWLAYFNTFVQTDAPTFDDAMRKGLMLRHADGSPYLVLSPRLTEAGLLDLENAEAREVMAGYLKTALGLGFDGWMADYGEWVPWDATTVSGAQACHNCYPDLWAELNRQVLESERPGGDGVFFVRAGHLGTVKSAPVVWAGDQNTDFDTLDGLPSIIPIGLNLGLSGASTYATDIAGYSNLDSPPTTKELYFRWSSLAALTPVMRTHHGNAADKNWHWLRDEETAAHFKRYAVLHQRLFPLWDALAAEASRSGLPILRSGWLVAPDDAKVAFSADQFWVGDSLLVAPVVTEGAQSRDVALPAGRHYDFWTSAAVEGGVRAVAAAPGDLPLFVRAGALVPLLPDGTQTIAPGGDAAIVTVDPALPSLELRVYLGAAGALTLADGTKITLESKAGDAAVAPLDRTGDKLDVPLGSARLSIDGPSRAWHIVPVGG